MTISTRPVISVYSARTGEKSDKSIACPSVLTSPIRPDIVRFVHTCLNKNARQPYAVSPKAGHQTSAVSWGTGRAVARIPRVSGGGNSRSGQGAFGNMCRGGRMFAPTKVWRKWHVKVNLRLRRAAIASALAASCVPAIVLARGHRMNAAELPLVISKSARSIKRAREAKLLLEKLGAYDENLSKKSLRAGKGKMRNRRFKSRLGPLIVYKKDNGITEAFRNLPGCETISVERLNLLKLAPGGHVGRFVIWIEDAFNYLNKFGSQTSVMAMPDVSRIIQSDEIQSVLTPSGPVRTKRPFTQRKNPLRNKAVMCRINPFYKEMKNRLIQREKSLKKYKSTVSCSVREKASQGARASPEFVQRLLSN